MFRSIDRTASSCEDIGRVATLARSSHVLVGSLQHFRESEEESCCRHPREAEHRRPRRHGISHHHHPAGASSTYLGHLGHLYQGPDDGMQQEALLCPAILPYVSLHFMAISYMSEV